MKEDAQPCHKPEYLPLHTFPACSQPARSDRRSRARRARIDSVRGTSVWSIAVFSPLVGELLQGGRPARPLSVGRWGQPDLLAAAHADWLPGSPVRGRLPGSWAVCSPTRRPLISPVGRPLYRGARPRQPRLAVASTPPAPPWSTKSPCVLPPLAPDVSSFQACSRHRRGAGRTAAFPG